ncbi:alpha/beta fold hydrolase [Kribbella italica]|uniref:Pimeloyl-ACP methyl ester carboxylesterase n=1 Tax=Kribbella italica TaxID=1540520 RepID=A0A7W9MYR5_9ACTN|nr:alpha/beta hydrolase [Kribbella italica]MBB5840662.1 pimeloyl-ACP methyl ester carboxylesterase [Kribbella italica]
MSNTVSSADGTTIAYDRTGSGPAVVLVDGALCSRAQGPMPDLAKELQAGFTVHTYDRRGRGESGDAGNYAPDREVEDLAALIEAAGGTAYVYGTSSGGALSLRAAAAGLPITKLAVFEAPFVVDTTRKPIPPTWTDDLRSLVDADRRSDAVKYFLTKGVGLPGPAVTMMKLLPAWKPMTELAHTLPYDAQQLGENAFGRPLDVSQWSALAMPVLIAAGGKSPAWMKNSMTALAAAVPTARHREIPGQSHIIKATAIAPVLTEFFSS